MVQVTSTDVRLLKGTKQLHRVALDMGGGVRSCDITDLYIVVLLTDGTVAQLHLLETGDTPTLQLTWPELSKGSKVTLISAYTDTSGLFAMETMKVESVGVVGTSVLASAEHDMSIEDEDELLYGDVDTLTAKINKKTSQKEAVTKKTTPTKSSWCAVYREDGSLAIHQIPNFKVVFGVRNFSSCPHTLKESGALTSE